MRVLVIGATGYIGNRVISALVNAGETVVAGARDPGGLDAFWWSDVVDRARVDAGDAASVETAITADLGAVVYLVHGMGGDDFAEKDRDAAQRVSDRVTAAGVPRVVYVSGIIPPIPDEELSEHLSSRLEVERILSESSATVVTLRAAMIVGSGSTSFELMSQLSDRLPVTVIPDWMQSQVEPVAVTDVVRAVTGALTAEVATGAWDVGGGEQIAYPDLIDRVATARGKERPQVSIPLLPSGLVGKIAAFLSDIPSSTVEALIESLREDMVARDTRWVTELVGSDAGPPVALDEAVSRSLADVDSLSRPSQRDLMGALPGDPSWASAADDSGGR